MFNNFGHVPFLSMTGKIVTPRELLMKLSHILGNAFTANLLKNCSQICKRTSNSKKLERMCIAQHVDLAVSQLRRTFGTLITDIYQNECQVCMFCVDFVICC